LVAWAVIEAKKPGLSAWLISTLRSEVASGVRVADSDDRGCMCRVSGMNIKSAGPKTNAEIPTIRGIHGDLAIKIDAIEGARISASRMQPPPIRKTFALFELECATCLWTTELTS
jgi:hypothetical protein